MKYAQSVLDLIGNTPLVKLPPRYRRHRGHGPGEAGIPEPRRFHQGPHRGEDDRGGRTHRQAPARRHHRGAHLRQHRRRPGAGGPAEGLPLHLRGAGQGRRGQARRAPGLRRRGGGDAHRRRPRQPAELLRRLGPPRHRDSGRLQARPVLQPGRPGQPLRIHRAGNLARHGRPHHTLRDRRRHRRHHHRHRPVPQGSLRAPCGVRRRHGQDHRRRPGRFGLLRRHRPAVLRRGRRRGHVARQLRQDRSRTTSSPSATPTPSK